MGARPGRSPGDLVCCHGLLRLLPTFFFVVVLCACVLIAMAAAADGASLGTNNAATTTMATGSPAQQRPGGADAFRSSERRIPKGPDPIHNRYYYTLLSC